MNDREILNRLWEACRETPFASFTLERKLNLTKSEYRDVLNLIGDMADSGEVRSGYRIKRVASTVYKMTQAQQKDSDSLKGLPLIGQKNRLQGNLRAIVYRVGARFTRLKGQCKESFRERFRQRVSAFFCDLTPFFHRCASL